MILIHSLNVISKQEWNLIDKTMPADGRCTLKEYLEGDNELQVYASDDWESNFLNSLATMIKSKIAIVKIVTMKM